MNKIEILRGHTSAETAYVVNDYPYGFRLRCKIRYWLEFRRGHGTRLMSQTTNPKVAGEVWNKPKGSTYRSGLAVAYLNAQGHFSWDTCGCSDIERFVEFRRIFNLNPRELEILDALESHSRKFNPVSWARVDGKAAGIAGLGPEANPNAEDAPCPYGQPGDARREWESARVAAEKSMNYNAGAYNCGPEALAKNALKTEAGHVDCDCNRCLPPTY